MTGENLAEASPPLEIAPEPQGVAFDDTGDTEIPESGLTGLDDASIEPVDASSETDDQPQIAQDGVDLGGWRLLSCGRKNGQVRFRMALGSGKNRKWDGPIITISESDSIAARNKNESSKQEQQRKTVNQLKGSG